jgi:hypothetical protein
LSRKFLQGAAGDTQQHQQQQADAAAASDIDMLQLAQPLQQQEQHESSDGTPSFGNSSVDSSSSSTSLLAQNQSFGVALDLQRQWVGYKLQQLGRAAAAPISSARRAVSAGPSAPA